MNYVVQTGPGASKEDRSRGLGRLSPGSSGGRLSEEAGDLLVSFGDGGGRSCGAEFHDSYVAVEP